MTEIKSPWPQEVGEIFCSSAEDTSRKPAMFYAPKTQQPHPLLVGLHQWGGDYLKADSLPYAEYPICPDWTSIHPIILEKERAAIAVAERERVAKRTAEEAFNEVFALKNSIRELEGIFNFLLFCFLIF